MAKSIVSMGLFALASACWLRAVGLGRWTVPVMFSTTLLAPSLFTSWYLPELDNLGAAALLWGAAQLHKEGPLPRRGVSVIAALLFGGFLKESSGLIAVGLFSAGALVHLVANEKSRMRRHLWAGGLTLGGWILLSLPMMLVQESMSAQESFWGKLQVIEHNSAQLVYLLGTAGVGLLALGVLLPRLESRFRGPALITMLVGLLASPLLVYYSHYEAIYYGHRGMALCLSAVLWVSLAVLATPVLKHLSDGMEITPADRGLVWCTLTILGVVGSVTGAVLIAPTAREDMASRIFILVAPMLHAAAMEGAARGWSSASVLPRALRGSTVGLLITSFAWYPIASSINFGVDWRALHPVDQEGRSQLVSAGIDNRVMLFNHYVQWMGHYEMRALGAPDSVETDTHFSQVYAWLGTERLPETDWGSGLLELEEGYELNIPMDLYWLSRRSQMSSEANTSLEGDLSWTRRPVGLFMPINWSPDDGPEAKLQSDDLPAHNLPEDLRMTRFRDGPTPLESLAESRGTVLWEDQQNYIQLPQNLLEIPRRLLGGVPLVERHSYEARHYRLGPRAGEPSGEISDILTLHEEHPQQGPPEVGGGPPGQKQKAAPPPAPHHRSRQR
jgi:hypothetical protein